MTELSISCWTLSAGIFDIGKIAKSGDSHRLKIDEERTKNDPLTIARQTKAANRKIPKLFITCGEKDFLYGANVKFKDDLGALGLELTWEALSDYQHEWRFWDLQVEKFLGWLPRSDPHSKTGKRQV